MKRVSSVSLVGLVSLILVSTVAQADGPTVVGPVPNVQMFQPTRYDIHALATPEGYDGAIALNVDDAGNAYGYAFQGSTDWFSQKRRAVRWDSEGRATKVGPDTAIDGATVGTINGKLVYFTRVVTGSMDATVGFVGDETIPGFVPNGVVGGKAYGFKHSSFAMSSHGDGYVYPTGAVYPGYGVSILAMNGSGVIAGTDHVPSQEYFYNMFWGQIGVPYHGMAPYGKLAAVDDSGSAVGLHTIPANSPQGTLHAYRFKPNTVPEDLGTLGGTESGANGVTGDGKTVVGWSYSAQGILEAFVYQNRKMYSLNNLVDFPASASVDHAPAPSPTLSNRASQSTTGLKPIATPETPMMWLREADGIANSGKICGVGYAPSDMKLHAWVAVPKPKLGLTVVNPALLSKMTVATPMATKRIGHTLATAPIK